MKTREGSSTEKRILIIEDDVDLIDLFKEALTLRGYVVDGAPTLARARDMLESNQYDLLISDVNIGQGRSLELLRKTVSTFKDTEVILLSGSSQFESIAQEIGVEFFLAKPVSLKPLVTLVQRLAPIEKVDQDATSSRISG